MADSRDRRDRRQLTRREALKLAGFSVAGASLGIGCGSEDDEGSSSAAYPSLFSPTTIGTFTVANRILSTAHHTGFAVGGLPSQRHLDYWSAKARGGIGLVITEVQPIHPTGGIAPSMIQCYRDGVVDAFRPVVEAVHEYDTKMIAQLWHPGKSIYPNVVSELVSSSAIPSFIYGGTPRALRIDEIHGLVRDYAEGAARMREAGLDGVEIHGAHGYLPQQFMSPAQNIRTDEYGGSEENRLRFAVEVIDAVRAAVGDDYTVGIRIAGAEFGGGLVIEDMRRIVPVLTASGKLDYVNVSVDGPAIIPPMGQPHGTHVHLAEAIREVVELPVFCIGRITDPSLADMIVAESRADMVGMTRANMTDPDLPTKAREGRADEIRSCIGLMVCWSRVANPDGITCALNPSVGREKELEIIPAVVSRRVMVIGGGIAGMEAARVAALRGHAVTLYEKEERLGGQLVAASKAPTRQEMERPIEYFERQFARLAVDVHLGASVTKELVAQEAPDVVIVATGGLPAELPVPGGDGDNVVQGRDVLLGKVETGQNVVVVAADGGTEGLTTADFLAEQGKDVEVIVPYASAASGVEQITAFDLFSRLGQKGVVTTSNTTVQAIEGDTVVVSSRGEERRIEGVDSVVLSLGSVSNDALLEALADAAEEVHAVGQCRKVGRIVDSTTDGLEVGRVV